MDILSKYFKRGYNLDDRDEFGEVRKFIIDNNCSPNNFDKNLSFLTISKSRDGISKYDAFSNLLYDNSNILDFMHELLHMASNSFDYKAAIGAMYSDGTGESLNEGITDYLTFLLTNKVEKSSYFIEVLYLDFLLKVYINISKRIIQKYFEGNPDKLYNLFDKDKERILSSIRSLDKYTRDYKNIGISLIKNGNLEKTVSASVNIYEEITDAFSKLIKIAKEKDEILANDLIKIFENKMKKYYKNDSDMIVDMLRRKIEGEQKL